ncbi:MAG: ZIP family metal transporter [Halobacteriales archaeon]
MLEDSAHAAGSGAVGYLAPAALLALSGAGYAAGVAPKVLAIAWIAFLAMAGAVPLGRRAARGSRARGLVWGYGLASGAMITSAAVFLVPGAIGHHPQFGGFGIAAGVLIGYSAHTIGHRLSHVETPFESTTVRLTAHALAAGAVIGLVYAATPDLGPLLGLAIVSHKAPAGYAAARRLAARGVPTTVLLVPATGVGLAAIPAALVAVPPVPAVDGAVFGFAAGVFLHVAMDFLPRCEVGSEIHQQADLGGEAGHGLLDRLRLHAVASTGLGALAVFLGWLVVA